MGWHHRYAASGSPRLGQFEAGGWAGPSVILANAVFSGGIRFTHC